MNFGANAVMDIRLIITADMRGFLSGLIVGAFGVSLLHAQGRGQASPASVPPPRSTTSQTFPADQVAAGQRLFTAQCGFCHGRDAMGGESGPDLTRAATVAEDVRGDKLAPVIRNGRTDKGMPGFPLSEGDMAAVVAFIHDTKDKADRKSVCRER